MAGHDDHLHDAIALTEAAGAGDTEGQRVLLRHGNSHATALTLARLLSALIEDNARGDAVCPGCFRDWALQAANRP